MKVTTKNYKIKKILNNSSLIVSDAFHEIVFIGKGIAFGLTTKEVLKKGTQYDQKYQSSNRLNQFSTLISGYSDLIIQMVMDTIQMIVANDNSEFRNRDLISISDHLAATYARIQKGEPIKSFFSFETKVLYPDVYEKAMRIAKVLELKYDIDIPEAEVSYIALHMQNLKSDKARENVEILTMIISDIYDLLTIEYKINLEQNSNNYLRFLTHLRFLVEGALNNKILLTTEVSDVLTKSYPLHTEIARKIIVILTEHLNIALSEKEMYYIIIHLVNISNLINETG